MKILLILIVATIVSNASAQSIEQDVVYLKNGSIVRGTLKEHIIGKELRIETVDGNLWVFQESEVLKITKENNPRLAELFETKTTNLVAVSLGVDEEPNSIGLEAYYGIRWLKVIGTSIGVGFHRIGQLDGRRPRITLPILLDWKFFFSRDDSKMYFFSTAGGGYTTDTQVDLAFLARAGVGLGFGPGDPGVQAMLGWEITSHTRASSQLKLMVGYSL